jgi:hypothetical protein
MDLYTCIPRVLDKQCYASVLSGIGVGAGRAKLRLSRGYPRRTRLRAHPLESFIRVDRDMRGHWHRNRNCAT